MARPFVLRRHHDVSGVSGTGIVAHGVQFPDGTVALRWVGGNPTSVVFHDNGIRSVQAIHGHGGHTTIEWGEPQGARPALEPQDVLDYLDRLGSTVRAARTARRLGRPQLAAKLGIGNATVWKFEKDTSSVNVSTLRIFLTRLARLR